MRRFIQTKGKSSRPVVWEIGVYKNEVHVQWGQYGGAMQETTQTFEGVNIGKSNEKTPEEVAQNWAKRQITLRKKKGYKEVSIDNTIEDIQKLELGTDHDTQINFRRLPENLRFFKPLQKVTETMRRLMDERGVLYLRKRDGLMHIISIDDLGYPRMYSSTMSIHQKDEPDIPWMERYPQIEEELIKLNLPGNTVLLGELVTTGEGFRDDKGDDIDDFLYVSGVSKSLTPRALQMQKEKGRLGFYIWDIAFWEGDCLLKEMPARDRFETINNLLSIKDFKYLLKPFIVDSESMSRQEALYYSKKRKWEGWVVIEKNAIYGDKSYSFHGKAERPIRVCKLKPNLEADFIVRWDPDNGIGERGKGKKSNGVGSVMAYLYDPESKKEIEICKIGGGLSDLDVSRFANPALYPMVWRVGFSEWTPKGALRFPKFITEREDKTPEECTIDQNPNMGE